MENSLIEILYYDFRENKENKIQQKEYFRLRDEGIMLYNLLNQTLDEEQKKLLTAFENALIGMEAEEGKLCFCEGFKLGFRMYKNIMEEDGSNS